MHAGRGLLAAVLLSGLLLSLTVSAAGAEVYRPGGDYANLAKRPPVEKAPPGQGGPFRVDKRRGVAGVSGAEPTYSAASDAWYGLWNYTRWLRSDKKRHLARAKFAAGWIAKKLGPDNLYRISTGATLVVDPPLRLEPGWYGALSQAMAASLLSRLYRVTGNRKYILRAKRGLEPLTRSKDEGGVTSRFLDTHLPFYEAYATLPVRAHTLTHHAFTLIGLYDMRRFSPLADRLFEEGMQALVNALPYYDLGDRVAVWLLHLTDPPRPITPISGWSQEVMLPALRDLQSVRPHPQLGYYIRRWQAQLRTICQNPAELCYFNRRR